MAQKRRQCDSPRVRYINYLFALILTGLLASQCLNYDEQGRIVSDDDPNMAIVAVLSGLVCTLLGVNIPTDAIARAIHALPPEDPPDEA